MKPMQTLITYNYSHEAGVLRSLLESEGINTFLTNETLVQVNPMLSNAVGGVELQVAADDLEKALQVMKEHGFEPGKPAQENPLVRWINRIMK